MAKYLPENEMVGISVIYSMFNRKNCWLCAWQARR